MIREEFTLTDKELDLIQRLVYAGLTVREAYALVRAGWMAIGSSFAKEQMGDKTYDALHELLKEPEESTEPDAIDWATMPIGTAVKGDAGDCTVGGVLEERRKVGGGWFIRRPFEGPNNRAFFHDHELQLDTAEPEAPADDGHLAWLKQVTTDAARRNQLVTLVFEPGLRVRCWVDGKAVTGQLHKEFEEGWVVACDGVITFVPYQYIWIDYMPDRHGIIQGTTCVRSLDDGDLGIVLHPMNAECTDYMVHWTAGSCPGSNLTIDIDTFEITS